MFPVLAVHRSTESKLTGKFSSIAQIHFQEKSKGGIRKEGAHIPRNITDLEAPLRREGIDHLIFRFRYCHHIALKPPQGAGYLRIR